MDASVFVEVIASAAAVAFAALSYLFTKRKEREADWRKWKYEQCKEFVTTLSGIVDPESTIEDRRNFARASNTLHLIGSKGALVALHAYQDETSMSNPDKSRANHDILLSKLIWEIRKDLEIPGTPDVDEFLARLWSSGNTTTDEQQKMNH